MNNYYNLHVQVLLLHTANHYNYDNKKELLNFANKTYIHVNLIEKHCMQALGQIWKPPGGRMEKDGRA